MSKKSSTIHIEQCFWDLIEDYQNANGMDSRNLAIECLLSEFKALKSLTQISFNINQSNLIDKHTTKTSAPQQEDLLKKKLLQMEDDMPD
ncbi:hypothetical protein PN398_06630 [Romboutsia sp. 1001216sp1]|uniref:hypothetical protein n=1 Tax=Romboutsia sp. 1001216sp1 TaxID=2986997 RepID=UPI00232F1667|nr:hypothetical protein [Romboutsia sp. 1001216sp1]MDB8790389.1 hypothetical protein [Romboutsia sp. 1001216sp1]